MKNPDINPMHSSPRCAAHSKRTGKPCRAPAVRGYRVCRMHGARSGAPRGAANGRYAHGLRTKEAAEGRKEIQDLVHRAKLLLATIRNSETDE